MAILQGALSEGSLLRRTLIHVGTFAFGSLAFVALLCFVLVSIAKSLLPSHTAKAPPDSAQTAELADEEEPGRVRPPKGSRSKRVRGVIVEEESPTGASGK